MSENEKSRDESNENNPTENMKSLTLKQNKPVRPQRLRIKTKQFYDVKLPTYEESQAKYDKFLCTLRNADEKQKQNEQISDEILNTVKLRFYLNKVLGKI